MGRLRFLAAVVTVLVMLLSGSAVVLAQEGTPASTLGGSEPATETLFTLSVDELPTGRGTVALIRWVLEPGPRPLVLLALDGPRFVAVESGEVTATEAGVEHPLAAGDVYVAADPAQEVAITVTGPEPASVFHGWVGTAPQIASWDGQEPSHVWLMKALSDLPGGSGRLVIERLVVPPGTALPPFTTEPLVWTDIGEGIARATLQGGDLPRGWEAGKERLSGAGTLTLVPIPVGTQIQLRNPGDDPLVLYRVSLIPETASGAVGTPSVATPMT